MFKSSALSNIHSLP